MPQIARRVRVIGRVQGVFFRAWTRDQARGLGVNGWVRNCRDGSVEGHFQGEQAAVRTLIELVQDGPSGARVDEVETTEARVDGLTTFEVRH